MSKGRPATTPSRCSSEGLGRRRRRRAADRARSRAKQRSAVTRAARRRRRPGRQRHCARHRARRLRARAQLCAWRSSRRRRSSRAARSSRSRAGESLTLSSDLFADLVPGTGSVALSVGLSTALDAAALLKALDRYPFGCSEQITSRALPLLYVNDLAIDGASRARRHGRPAHPRSRSTGCWRGRAPTARSGCGRRAAMTSGSTPMSPTS